MPIAQIMIRPCSKTAPAVLHVRMHSHTACCAAPFHLTAHMSAAKALSAINAAMMSATRMTL
jgi:hypothetical protein